MKKHLVRQFQMHMMVTVAVISLFAVLTFLWMANEQSQILPDKTALYIDVLSTYADGKSNTDTYVLDLASTSTPKKYESKNDVSAGAKFDDVLIEVSDDDNFILVDKSKIQTGMSVSISSIKNGFSMLSEENQQRYKRFEYLKYILPAVYFIAGILISCFIFYRVQMKKPILMMEDAAEKISQNNLDFVIASPGKNELGRLCESMEKMRKSLADNNKEMFKLMEDKRKLQASVAHDLRNPIAIMQGYLEMMENELDESDFSKESIESSVNTLINTADRMEQYVESVNMINHLEDMDLKKTQENIHECIKVWKDDLSILTKQSGIKLLFEKDIDAVEKDKLFMISIDMNAVSRILENIVGNSLRYAKKQIDIKLHFNANKEMIFDICDDGVGYPEKLLNNSDLYFFTTEQKEGHMGMGMTICKILCRKHGGSISISNGVEGGARTIVRLKCLDC